MIFKIVRIAFYAMVGAGFALGVAGCALLGIENAQYDYYAETSRQLAGWLLCMTPIGLALGCMALTILPLVLQKLSILNKIGTFALPVFALCPIIYMITNWDYTIPLLLVIISTALLVAGAACKLCLYFLHEIKQN